MHIKVPVAFFEKVVPKGARKPRDELFGSWVDVELKEVSDVEAPIAMRWTGSAMSHHYPTVDDSKHLRYFDGKFWKPSVYSVSREPNVHNDIEAVLERTKHGYYYGNPLITGTDWQVKEFINDEIEAFDPDNFREVHTAEAAAATRRAVTAANHTLIVDGMVYEQAEEPAYKVSHSNYFEGSYTSIDVVPASSSEYVQSTFRADRYEDALRYALDTHGAELTDEFKIELYIPECVQHDDEYPALHDALVSAVKYAKGSISDKDKPTIEAWVDLRDAVNVLSINKTPDTISDAVSAAQVWTIIRDDEWEINKLKTALDRWENRPITFELDNGHSLSM